MSKAKKPPALLATTDQPGPNAFTVDDDGGKKSRARLLVECAVLPSLNGACVVRDYSPLAGETLDLTELSALLAETGKQVAGGDMRPVETMLMSQATALQAIFTTLAHRSTNNMKAGYLQATETYLKLALKAQSQCRATLETLANVKNPPIFAKQANIANGPQQVNNGGQPPALPPPSTRAHAGEIENPPNKLLEHVPCETLPAPAGLRNAEPVKLPVSVNGSLGMPLQVHEL